MWFCCADQEAADRTSTAGEDQRLFESVEESRIGGNQQRCELSFSDIHFLCRIRII